MEVNVYNLATILAIYGLIITSFGFYAAYSFDRLKKTLRGQLIENGRVRIKLIAAEAALRKERESRSKMEKELSDLKSVMAISEGVKKPEAAMQIRKPRRSRLDQASVKDGST